MRDLKNAPDDTPLTEPDWCGHRATLISCAVYCGNGGNCDGNHVARVDGSAAREALGYGDHLPVTIEVRWLDTRPVATVGDMRRLIARHVH